jgi:PKD repeat protein
MEVGNEKYVPSNQLLVKIIINMKYIASLLFIVILMNSCKKEEELENYEIKIDASNNIPPPPFKVDFKIFYNMDSANVVSLKNLSTAFEKCTWIFGDSTTSNEVNPTHTFSKIEPRVIKLIIENKNKNKDSLIISFNPTIFIGSYEPERLLIGLDPITYTITQNAVIYNSDLIYAMTHISYTDHYIENPEKYIYNVRKFVHTYNDLLSHTYYLYHISNNDKVIGYKKYTTMDLSNISSLFSNISGNYNFTSRFMVKYDYRGGSIDIDTIQYNDTTLNVYFTSTGAIRVEDTKLSQGFSAFLSSRSTSSNYVFYFDKPNSPGTIDTHYDTYFSVSSQFNEIKMDYSDNYDYKFHGAKFIHYIGTR